MRALFDFVLLVAGVVFPLSIFGSVLLSQSRPYYAWVKLVSLLGGVAALTWGGIEAVVLYLPVRPHTLSLLEASRLAVAVCCLTCIFALLIARRRNRPSSKEGVSL